MPPYLKTIRGTPSSTIQGGEEELLRLHLRSRVCRTTRRPFHEVEFGTRIWSRPTNGVPTRTNPFVQLVSHPRETTSPPHLEANGCVSHPQPMPSPSPSPPPWTIFSAVSMKGTPAAALRRPLINTQTIMIVMEERKKGCTFLMPIYLSSLCSSSMKTEDVES